MSERRIRGTIRDFAATAALAKRPVMTGSGDGLGRLSHQPVHLQRITSAPMGWGGSSENRMRFPVEIVRAIRGGSAGLHHHLPPLHAGSGGAGLSLEDDCPCSAGTGGVTLINTGIGWHEARIPDHRHQRRAAPPA